jgi:hypothetical protein
VKQIAKLILISLAACASVAAQTQQPVRINCAGPSYTDSKGNVWQSDADFNGGSAIDLPAQITGTADPTLYQTGRRNNGSTPTVYTIPLVNGSYHVNLYFAETWSSAESVGARVFNVKMQGAVVFTNVDVFAEAGANAALEKGTEVSVTNGSLAIELDSVVGDAKVNAIEVLPGVSGPSLTLNFNYPDGTPVAGTLNYTVTSSLLSFQGTAQLVKGSVQTALFANPSSLGISAQFTVKLSLTDSAGNTLWQMNVGMNPADVNLAAVQSSSLNVTVQKM